MATRDPNNAVKLRAQTRALEVGKTLARAYIEAGVNKNYLSEIPKGGWRRDKLERVARALEWTYNDLMPAGLMPAPHVAVEISDKLWMMAIEAAVELLYAASAGAPVPPRQIAETAVRLRQILQGMAERDTMPTKEALKWFARELDTAMRQVSSESTSAAKPTSRSAADANPPAVRRLRKAFVPPNQS